MPRPHFKNIEIETQIYEEILDELEWRGIKKPDGSIELTMDGIFPIIVNKKRLIKLQKNHITHDPSTITFRPYKNGRQCQFLIDKLIEEDGVKTVNTFKEVEDGNPLYSAILIQEETDEVMLQIDGCRTETEAKFRLFVGYYFGDKYDDDIDLMIEEEERFKEMKARQDEERKRKEEEDKKNKRRRKKDGTK